MIVATNQKIPIGNPSFVNTEVKWEGAYLNTRVTAKMKIVGIIYLPLTCGTLNLDSGLFGCFCSTITPAQTNTNANKVPMLVNANTISRFKNKAGTATTNPVKIVEKEGVLYLG